MKKITKLMLTLALLLVGVTGAKAVIKTYWNPSSPWSEFANCKWTAETNTFSWNGTHDVVRAIQTGFSGDLSAYTTFHATISNMTDGVENLSLKINSEEGTEQIINLVSGENNIDLTTCFKSINSENVTTFELWGPKIGVENCSAVLTDVYLGKPDPELEDRDEPEEPAAPKRGTLIKSYDYTTATSFPWYRQAAPEGSSYDVEDGKLVITNSVSQTNNWDLQPFILDQIPLKKGTDYVVRIKMNTTGAGNATINMGTWGSNRYNSFSFADDYAYYDVTLNDSPLTTDDENVAHALFQSGKFVGKIAIYKVEVYELAPIQWTNIIPEELDIRCFRSKDGTGSSIVAPTIDEDGAFVVKSNAMSEGDNGGDWESQFWIRLPQSLDAGTKFKVSFDGKASEAVTVGSQSHNEPGQYVTWQCMNTVNLTTGWQSFEVESTVPAECNGGKSQNGNYLDIFHSVAFNLAKDSPIDYYFKNIKFYVDVNDVTDPDYVYTVTGTANLCGTAWDVSSNPMTFDEETGLYTWTAEEVTVTSGSNPEFKIVQNGNWDTSWPANNYVITIGADGKYDITITFNYKTGEVNATYEKHLNTYTATFTTNLGWEHVYAYAWTGEGASKVEPLGTWNEKKYEMTANAAGVYELSFKAESAPANIIFHNGDGQQTSDLAFVDGKAYTWDLNYYVMSEDLFGSWDASEAGKMTKNTDGTYTLSMEGKELSSDQQYKVMKDLGGQTTWYPENQVNNNVIGINMAGTYDIAITIDPANNNRISEAMSIYKPITAAGYATFCAPYDLNFVGTGVQAYFAKYQDGRVNFYEIFNAPANTGLLLKGAEGTYKLKMESVTDGAADVTGNKLIGVNEETVVDHSGIFVLMNGTNGVGFYKTTAESFTVGAHTAYIDAIDGARSFISLDEETTSIADNNRVTITNNGDIYNLNGQRVAQPTKGLYIVNGKKVVVK